MPAFEPACPAPGEKPNWVFATRPDPAGEPRSLSMPDRIPPLPDDGIYRAILLVMVLTVIFGAFVTLAGYYYFQSAAISRFGVGVVMVGGLIYLVFRLLGRREARRRATRDEAGGEPPDRG